MSKDSQTDKDEYALMILRNRLAKGEITIDEFNRLSEALNTPVKESDISKIKEDMKSLRENVSSRSYKNSKVAVSLAVIFGLIGIMGIGHLYIRKKGRGAAILIGGIVLDIIIGTIIYDMTYHPEFIVNYEKLLTVLWAYLIVYFGIFVVQIIDVRRQCQKYNSYIDKYKKAPW